MIEYIYFVKCPNCEEEHFNFFDDAKDFALGCLSKKPIITQTEVCRNDFGECTDSSDLGTVWSWEDMMQDVPADDPALSVFTKDDLAEYNPDQDPEFSDLSNSLDDIPDNFVKPIPADMTIEALVEEMEENEDTVECKWCHELFDKSEVRYEVDLGYLCDQCSAAIKSRGETLTFRDNTYDDFLNEDISKETVDLEYDELTTTVCSPKRDVDDWDEVEYSDSYTFTLDKTDVATTIWENFITEEDVADIPGGLEALEDDSAWNTFLETHFDILFEKYYEKLLDYYRDDAIEAFGESSSYDDYIANQEAERADREYDAWRDEQFNENLDWHTYKITYSLKNNPDKEHTTTFKTWQSDVEYAWRKSASNIPYSTVKNIELIEELTDKKPDSVLEELEDADTYKKRLTMCPECGADTYDLDTGFCINCGFNTL